MTEFIQSASIEIAIGLVLGVLALRSPFRKLVGRADVGWDIVAALLTTAFVIAADALLVVPLDFTAVQMDGWYPVMGEAPLWLVLPGYLVLADFGAYWAHRALHTRWLWSTHAWHHSIRHLYWLAGLRASPVHVLVLAIPFLLAYMMFPLPETALVGLGFLVLSASNQHFIHSNVKIPYAKQIERIFVTPRYHFVHHSARPHVSNSNYGFTFSIWDRLFDTYTDPDALPADDVLGLSYEVSGWRLALGLPPRVLEDVKGIVAPE